MKEKKLHKPLKAAKTIEVDSPSGEGKKMQVRTAIKHREVLTALAEVRGHISKACQIAGISRDCYYDFMKDPDFATAVQHIREGVTDDYIDALHSLALDAKVFPAVKYYLDNHAQDRGYGKEVQAATNKLETTNNVQINLASLSPELLQQLKAALTKKE